MDKKLLTPGPLTTSKTTKEAMLHDWGSRDQKFIDLNQSIRDSLINLIDDIKISKILISGLGPAGIAIYQILLTKILIDY